MIPWDWWFLCSSYPKKRKRRKGNCSRSWRINRHSSHNMEPSSTAQIVVVWGAIKYHGRPQGNVVWSVEKSEDGSTEREKQEVERQLAQVRMETQLTNMGNHVLQRELDLRHEFDQQRAKLEERLMRSRHSSRHSKPASEPRRADMRRGNTRHPLTESQWRSRQPQAL